MHSLRWIVIFGMCCIGNSSPPLAATPHTAWLLRRRWPSLCSHWSSWTYAARALLLTSGEGLSNGALLTHRTSTEGWASRTRSFVSILECIRLDRSRSPTAWHGVAPGVAMDAPTVILGPPGSLVWGLSPARLAAQELLAHSSSTALTSIQQRTGCLETEHTPTILGPASETLKCRKFSNHEDVEKES